MKRYDVTIGALGGSRVTTIEAPSPQMAAMVATMNWFHNSAPGWATGSQIISIKVVDCETGETVG